MKAGFSEIFLNAKLAALHIFQGHLSAGNWCLLQAWLSFSCSDSRGSDGSSRANYFAVCSFDSLFAEKPFI